MTHQNRINLQVLNVKCYLNIHAVEFDFQAIFYVKIQIYAFKNPFWSLSDCVIAFHRIRVDYVIYVFEKRRTQFIPDTARSAVR